MFECAACSPDSDAISMIFMTQAKIARLAAVMRIPSSLMSLMLVASEITIVSHVPLH